MGTKASESPENARPLMVFSAGRATGPDARDQLRRLLPAVAISFTVNFALALVFFSIDVSHAQVPRLDAAVFETDVEENTKPPNLENDEIGLDADVQTNYRDTRIEDISVPGPVNLAERVGIHNAPPGPPMTLPPPPGVGGNVGTGSGIDNATRPGTGNLIGLPGSLGGPLIPGSFNGRGGATREQLLREGGGNTASEASVAAGLKWIASHQAPDGHWSLRNFQTHGGCNCTGAGHADNDIAATAFALLPMLGAGQTHRLSPDKASGRYATAVDKGLKYLILKQNREGAFYVSASANTHMYAHGLATIAVCEAYGLTADPALRRPAQLAINYIARAQSPEGGWRYDARGAKGFDTSVGGWQVMALKSGQMAGLDVPAITWRGSKEWLDAAQTDDGGGYGYTSNKGETPTLSAVGLLCRQYLGWGPRNPGLIAGSRRLQETGPMPNETYPDNNMYYNYYATQVLHHLGGPGWDIWNRRMRDQLIVNQDRGGTNPHQAGSWSPKGDRWSASGGRLMSTSLSVLTLEVYYRHLPLYRRDLGGDRAVLDN